ncbi:MAG: ABC transporter, zinc transport system ATP-binding protein [Candidatus Peregrinibacteria bacterium GW2011_GWE2_39_6]|nr:MAG: ABC transporter, zinc transport system ATP-binding protein [Candidatus Peregrinibacteria bacterium GW2011_GWF2_39_17]KKR24188.1 MAG: ABC transporter, zinc transport system ATP-binding protein [Candidatus Peregrinibacteria bacterium GW2011_GWE2_39_6]HCW32100.1 ABC transporter ATP-binding protein [Candidatus Peregrinibacteria bacterium]
MNEIIIDVKNVSIRFGQNKVIDDISFQVERGDFIGLAGPNGAGKTTLAKAILCLLPLESGTITLFGQHGARFNYFSKIGYLPQKNSNLNSIFPASVEEVVSLGLLAAKKIPKVITKSDQSKVRKTLGELGILKLKNKMLSELSGGQQQRVLLARALVSEPELLVFDEPSTALDPASRNNFFRLIRTLNRKKGITIILITHDTGYIGNYANKLLYIDRRLVYFGEISAFCKPKKGGHFFEKTDNHIIWHQHN